MWGGEVGLCVPVCVMLHLLHTEYSSGIVRTVMGKDIGAGPPSFRV